MSNINYSIIFATFILGTLLLFWCITSESYQSFRDEHDDIREDPVNLLREDDLWDASAQDNIYDPDNLFNMPDPQTILHSQSFLNTEAERTHLMQPEATDYMGQYNYNKNNIYQGSLMEYPTHKTGGWYMSPSYEMPVEDKHDLLRKGMNFYNFDFVDPLLRQIEAGKGLSEFKENYDNIGGDLTPLNRKEGMSTFGRAHIGAVRQDSDHAYMHLDVVGKGVNSHLDEISSGYSHQGDDFYDEEDYNDGGPGGGLEPRELRDMPRHPSGMSMIATAIGVEDNFLQEAERNWPNIGNMGSNLDIQNGAYGIPLSNEMNIFDPKQIDRLRYEKLGIRDVSPALLNHDLTYEYNGEGFMSARDTPNYTTNYDRKFFTDAIDPPIFPGEENLKYKSFITDVSFSPPPRGENLIPLEENLWKTSMRIPDHSPLTS